MLRVLNKNNLITKNNKLIIFLLMLNGINLNYIAGENLMGKSSNIYKSVNEDVNEISDEDLIDPAIVEESLLDSMVSNKNFTNTNTEIIEEMFGESEDDNQDIFEEAKDDNEEIDILLNIKVKNGIQYLEFENRKVKNGIEFVKFEPIKIDTPLVIIKKNYEEYITFPYFSNVKHLLLTNFDNKSQEYKLREITKTIENINGAKKIKLDTEGRHLSHMTHFIKIIRNQFNTIIKILEYLIKFKPEEPDSQDSVFNNLLEEGILKIEKLFKEGKTEYKNLTNNILNNVDNYEIKELLEAINNLILVEGQIKQQILEEKSLL